jgi:hypothetical protein
MSERTVWHEHFTRMNETEPFHWVIWCRCGWEAKAPRGYRQAARIARQHQALNKPLVRPL